MPPNPKECGDGPHRGAGTPRGAAARTTRGAARPDQGRPKSDTSMTVELIYDVDAVGAAEALLALLRTSRWTT